MSVYRIKIDQISSKRIEVAQRPGVTSNSTRAMRLGKLGEVILAAAIHGA